MSPRLGLVSVVVVPIFGVLAVSCGASDETGAASSAAASSGDATTAASSGGGDASSSKATSGAGGQGTGGEGASSTSTATGAGGSGGAPPTCTAGAVEDCYDGPLGTEGVGPCLGGQRTCTAEGVFGPCVGQVTPKLETCLTPADDDCNGQVNEGGAGCVCVPGASQACYGGPPGTQDIGMCVGGTAVCDVDGLGLLPCAGEVVPGPENCLFAPDEDCNGLSEVCTGAHALSFQLGDSKAQIGAGIAAFQGGPIVTGSFQGTVDFGGGGVTTAGSDDVYVASYNYLGMLLWAHTYGDGSSQNGVGVALDSAASTFVVGDFAGTIDFGGGALTSAGSSDVFLLKLDAAGGYLWSKRFGDSAAQLGLSVAVDTSDSVVITGSFSGTIDFGGGALVSAGSTDVYVAKFDSAGNHVWSHSYGNSSAQAGKGVSTGPADEVVITGDLAGTADFGGGVLTSAGGTDVFVAKLDKSGAHVWSKNFGNTSNQNGRDVALDSVGNVVLVGDAVGKIDFGGGLLTSAGSADVFVAKLSAAGTHLWSGLYGTASAQNGRSVAVDPVDAIVVLGDFAGSIDFGGGSMTTAGSTDVFIAKLDPLGAHVWSYAFGNSAAQVATDIAADATGVLFTGNNSGTVDFGGGNLVSAGSTDAFIAKVLP